MNFTQEQLEQRNAEEQFLHRLVELGLLEKITPPLPPEQYPKDRKPVVLDGQPLSEFIIEERR
jgi:hypothetical protein